MTSYEKPDSATSYRMRRVRRRDTACEMALRRALYAQGFRYRVDRQVIPDQRTRADIVFSAKKVAIFVDGCFWHGCPIHVSEPKRNAGWWREKLSYNRHRDREVNAALYVGGWTVVRIWEHEDPVESANRIAGLLRRASPAKK